MPLFDNAYFDVPSFSFSGSTIGRVIVLVATFPSFQASKEIVSLAAPMPASCGTGTAPRNTLPQQGSSSGYRRLIGGPLSLAGNSTSTTGYTPIGKAGWSLDRCVLTTTQHPFSAFIVPILTLSLVGLSPR